MKIKKARKEDAKKMSLLRKKSFENILSKYYPKKVINYVNQTHRPKDFLDQMNKKEMFCAWEKNKLIGIIHLEKHTIGGLYVRPSLIGKGIGTKLMDFIENKAKKMGIKTVKLYPTKFALTFYKKRGYKISKKLKWETPYFTRDSIELKKTLIFN